jgi:hypothetical protein
MPQRLDSWQYQKSVEQALQQPIKRETGEALASAVLYRPAYNRIRQRFPKPSETSVESDGVILAAPWRVALKGGRRRRYDDRHACGEGVWKPAGNRVTRTRGSRVLCVGGRGGALPFDNQTHGYHPRLAVEIPPDRPTPDPASRTPAYFDVFGAKSDGSNSATARSGFELRLLLLQVGKVQARIAVQHPHVRHCIRQPFPCREFARPPIQFGLGFATCRCHSALRRSGAECRVTPPDGPLRFGARKACLDHALTHDPVDRTEIRYDCSSQWLLLSAAPDRHIRSQPATESSGP